MNVVINIRLSQASQLQLLGFSDMNKPLGQKMTWWFSCSLALAVLFGLLYLYGRYLYFHGYSASAQGRWGIQLCSSVRVCSRVADPLLSAGRLEPLYFSAKMQWVLIAVAGLGVVCTMTRVYLGLDLLHVCSHVLGLTEHAWKICRKGKL